MKKAYVQSVFLLAFFLSISSASAAPAPWGVALNSRTHECAGFWPGDEFVVYRLPEGWTAYFPKYDPATGSTSITTAAGRCDFKRKGDEKRCCAQLGYAYRGDNIGRKSEATGQGDAPLRRDTLRNAPSSP